jgi:hypothetical protein
MSVQAQSVERGTPVLHFQLTLPKMPAPRRSCDEQYESLWSCVNRICDHYLSADSGRTATSDC